MRTYQYTYPTQKKVAPKMTVKVGVAGSGNLEVIVRSSPNTEQIEFLVKTIIEGFEDSWKAVIDCFARDFPYGGLSFTLQDAGAAPPIVALRLRQAFETYQSGYDKGKDYLELSARERVYSLVNDFQEFLLDEDCNSPNLAALKMQAQDDDGIVIGVGKLDGKQIAIASQQKDFIGGSVGEIHGAKINGLVKYAIKHQLEAIILLIDSGGVRLQEANVGEIEISEIIRSLLEAKSSGVKTIGVICGNNGAFGGMGILSGVLDVLIVNQVSRIGISGAEVIQAVKGIETFDASDRPLVWQVYGGKMRFAQGSAQYYVSNEIAEIQNTLRTAIEKLDKNALITVQGLSIEQAFLEKRIKEDAHTSS
jgi:malonate decarboxylase beta subunit